MPQRRAALVPAARGSRAVHADGRGAHVGTVNKRGAPSCARRRQWRCAEEKEHATNPDRTAAPTLVAPIAGTALSRRSMETATNPNCWRLQRPRQTARAAFRRAGRGEPHDENFRRVPRRGTQEPPNRRPGEEARPAELISATRPIRTRPGRARMRPLVRTILILLLDKSLFAELALTGVKGNLNFSQPRSKT